MSSDQNVAISVTGVSKSYLLYQRPQDRFKQFFMPRIREKAGLNRNDYFMNFAALSNITFDVKRGEVFGIVGRNGSGKSTLLQIIAGTLNPSAGDVALKGRVAALLELGAGFNPEFTGRENIYSYAALLGVSQREIHERFDEITDFAGLGSFIEQPVKTYSSGMYVRLAFAVTACLDPDVLIVDEALAVGDAAFQAKCFRRFDELLAKGTTILFVSHSTDQVTRHCHRALLLEAGSILEMGDPRHVANCYLDLLFGVRKEAATAVAPSEGPRMDAAGLPPGAMETRPGYNSAEYRWGSGAAELGDAVFSNGSMVASNVWHVGSKLYVDVTAKFMKDVERPIFGLTIKTPDGVTVYGSNSRDFDGGPLWRAAKAGDTMRTRFILDHHLIAGDYLVSLGLAEDISGEVVPLDRRYDVFTLKVQGVRATGFGLADLHMNVSAL
jgi:lipopolysaccharide transport system ATP-binding protein